MDHDKVLHFTAGALLAFMGLLHSPMAAFLLPLLAGGLKEGYDRATGRGHPEVADAIWTWMGGLLPVVAWLALAAT